MATDVNNFDLTDITPRRDTLSLPSGVIEFISRSEFSAEDLNELSRLQKAVQSALRLGESKSQSDKKRGARALDKALDGLIRCVIPDLVKTEEWSGMKAGQKLTLITWWTEQNQQKEDELAAFLADDLGEV